MTFDELAVWIKEDNLPEPRSGGGSGSSRWCYWNNGYNEVNLGIDGELRIDLLDDGDGWQQRSDDVAFLIHLNPSRWDLKNALKLIGVI
jgi:hypothetical protein